MHDQHIGAGVDLRNVGEVSVGVVLGQRVQTVRHSVLAHTGHDDGVTVRGGLKSALGTDHAAGATDVFDNEGLFEDLAEFFGGHATHDVAGAARREWHDEFDRLVRVIGLGQCGQWQCGGQGGHGRQADEVSANHVLVSFVIKIKICCSTQTPLHCCHRRVCQSFSTWIVIHMAGHEPALVAATTGRKMQLCN